MIYGGLNTIHRTGQVNVEVDANGKVVSVWFRCMPLPFDQRVVDDARAADMTRMYVEVASRPSGTPNIEAIIFDTPDESDK